jgi:predicted transcriptional regulator
VKVKKIHIKTLNKGLKDFATAYRKATSGKASKKKEGTFFASVKAVRKILTETRLKLLSVVKNEKPSSIYELAALTGRDFKNVSADVHFLAEMGLIELKSSSRSRKQRQPVLVTDHIVLDLAL